MKQFSAQSKTGSLPDLDCKYQPTGPKVPLTQLGEGFTEEVAKQLLKEDLSR